MDTRPARAMSQEPDNGLDADAEAETMDETVDTLGAPVSNTARGLTEDSAAMYTAGSRTSVVTAQPSATGEGTPGAASVGRPHATGVADTRHEACRTGQLGASSRTQLGASSSTQLSGSSNTQLGASSSTQLSRSSSTQLGASSSTQLGGSCSTQLSRSSSTQLGASSSTQLSRSSSTQLGGSSSTQSSRPASVVGPNPGSLTGVPSSGIRTGALTVDPRAMLLAVLSGTVTSCGSADSTARNPTQTMCPPTYLSTRDSSVTASTVPEVRALNVPNPATFRPGSQAAKSMEPSLCESLKGANAVFSDVKSAVEEKRMAMQQKYLISHPRKNLKNVLTRMEDEQGPFSILYRSVKERLPLKVWTRSSAYVRGICSGYLLAYDKHFNLVMSDVEEVYRNPKNYLAAQRLEKQRRKKTKKKNKKKKKCPVDKDFHCVAENEVTEGKTSDSSQDLYGDLPDEDSGDKTLVGTEPEQFSSSPANKTSTKHCGTHKSEESQSKTATNQGAPSTSTRASSREPFRRSVGDVIVESNEERGDRHMREGDGNSGNLEVVPIRQSLIEDSEDQVLQTTEPVFSDPEEARADTDEESNSEPTDVAIVMDVDTDDASSSSAHAGVLVPESSDPEAELEDPGTQNILYLNVEEDISGCGSLNTSAAFDTESGSRADPNYAVDSDYSHSVRRRSGGHSDKGGSFLNTSNETETVQDTSGLQKYNYDDREMVYERRRSRKVDGDGEEENIEDGEMMSDSELGGSVQFMGRLSRPSGCLEEKPKKRSNQSRSHSKHRLKSSKDRKQQTALKHTGHHEGEELQTSSMKHCGEPSSRGDQGKSTSDQRHKDRSRGREPRDRSKKTSSKETKSESNIPGSSRESKRSAATQKAGTRERSSVHQKPEMQHTFQRRREGVHDIPSSCKERDSARDGGASCPPRRSSCSMDRSEEETKSSDRRHRALGHKDRDSARDGGVSCPPRRSSSNMDRSQEETRSSDRRYRAPEHTSTSARSWSREDREEPESRSGPAHQPLSGPDAHRHQSRRVERDSSSHRQHEDLRQRLREKHDLNRWGCSDTRTSQERDRHRSSAERLDWKSGHHRESKMGDRDCTYRSEFEPPLPPTRDSRRYHRTREKESSTPPPETESRNQRIEFRERAQPRNSRDSERDRHSQVDRRSTLDRDRNRESLHDDNSSVQLPRGSTTLGGHLRREYDDFIDKMSREYHLKPPARSDTESVASPDEDKHQDEEDDDDDSVLTRHVNQLFIRGDNVVMVALVDSC